MPSTLRSLPDGFGHTRDALHQLAFFALAPRRFAATERLGLTATPGGFGTPPWPAGGGDEAVRMEGATMVHLHGDHQHMTTPGTVREACEFLGIEYQETWFPNFHDPLAPAGPDVPLDIDDEAAAALGDWFAFGTAVLEQVRATLGAADPSTVQLWPEHFDPACELGSQDAGQRASFGASPGDKDHAEPYLYVAPWGDIDRSDEYWNDTAFTGASLSYADLLAAEDPTAAAVDFLRRGHALLTS